MKIIKSIISIMFCSFLLVSVGPLALASDIHPDIDASFIESDEYSEGKSLVIVSEEYAKSMMESASIRSYGWSEKSTTLATERKTIRTTPTGQLSDGYRFPTGGSVYINTSGGSSVSVGVSLSWSAVSVSVSLNSGAASNSVTGISVNIPANNFFYRVVLDHVYRFNHVQVDVYQYGIYKHTYFTTHRTQESITARTVRV